MQMPSGLRTTTAYTVDVQLANGLCYAVRFRFSRFERLHAEHLLYVPTDSAYHRAGWRALFLALWPRRHTWSAPDGGDDGAAAEQRFAISVSARFRLSLIHI